MALGGTCARAYAKQLTCIEKNGTHVSCIAKRQGPQTTPLPHPSIHWPRPAAAAQARFSIRTCQRNECQLRTRAREQIKGLMAEIRAAFRPSFAIGPTVGSRQHTALYSRGVVMRARCCWS